MKKRYFYTAEEIEKLFEYEFWTDREKAVLEYRYKRGMSIVDVSAEINYSMRTVNRIIAQIDDKAQYILN